MDPFISVDDLNAVTGTTVDGGSLIVAIALDAACESVRSYMGQTINYVAGDVAELDGNGQKKIRLPQRPVRALTSVVLDDVTLEADDFHLHGAIIRLKNGGVFTEGFGNVVVTYDHGYNVLEPDPNVPADIRLVALLSARRVYAAVGVTDVGEKQSETMGSYSYTNATTAAIVSTAAELLPAETDVLDRYTVRKVP